MKNKFDEAMVYKMSWQEVKAIQTVNGHYRVEITWALDRYRISAYRRVQEPEKLIRVRHAWYARTAAKTANKMLRQLEGRTTDRRVRCSSQDSGSSAARLSEGAFHRMHSGPCVRYH